MDIIGRLTKDAQVCTLSNEKQVVNFSVAINDSYKNKQGERVEQTTFFDCAYWMSMGVAKALKKGGLVELTGRVSARAWTGKDGGLKAGLNFHVSNIKLHGVPRVSEGSSKKTGVANDNQPLLQEATDDLPF